MEKALQIPQHRKVEEDDQEEEGAPISEANSFTRSQED
jgi:hypothetical protein